MTPSEKNALAVNQYLVFLEKLLHQRLKDHFGEADSLPEIANIRKIISAGDDSEISLFIREHALEPAEVIILLLALATHVKPGFFDNIISRNLPQSGDFPQLGGVRGKTSRGFIPSGETALFVLAGNQMNRRFDYLKYFGPEHLFSTQSILWLEEPEKGEPFTCGRLILAPDYIELFTRGKFQRPRLTIDFPAEYISTELNEEDLVLPSATLEQLRELEHWINYREEVMHKWGMGRWQKPGYRALFHGPPGTGKTLSALILGKKTNRDVYRIDLSMVVSKFIGETEKNLSYLFERAKNKDWILFFDEADALFGKRTHVRDAHDKYANQEVAYLLQRIENHNGLVILASNFKSNIDDAFIRRFQSVIYIPPPSVNERFQLWKKALPVNNELNLPDDNALMAISKKYEINGAGIVNAIYYCCLDSLSRKSKVITIEQIRAGIEREYQKEGKIV